MKPRVDPVAFIERVLGLDLRDFQRDWLRQAFSEVDGKRRYTRALWGLPRGNGKSHLAAAVAGYMLLADKPRDGRPPQVIITAGAWNQAMITFKRLREMLEASPLRDMVTVLSGRGFMRIKGGAELFVVTAEGPLQHGLEPTCVVFDEVWNQKKRELYEALIGGMIKRSEPVLAHQPLAPAERGVALRRQRGRQVSEVGTAKALVSGRAVALLANGRCTATRGSRLAFTSARGSRAWCRGWFAGSSSQATVAEVAALSRMEQSVEVGSGPRNSEHEIHEAVIPGPVAYEWCTAARGFLLRRTRSGTPFLDAGVRAGANRWRPLRLARVRCERGSVCPRPGRWRQRSRVAGGLELAILGG